MSPFLNLWHQTEIVHRIGWVLVHSFWQFTAIAIATAFILTMVRRVSPRVRYGVLLAGLLAIAAAPIITWQWTSPAATPDGWPLLATQAKAPTRTSLLPAIDSISNDAGLRHATESLADHGQADHAQGDHADDATSIGSHTAAPLPSPTRTQQLPTSNFAARVTVLVSPFISWLAAVWAVGVLVFSVRPTLGWFVVRRLQTQNQKPVSTEIQARFDRIAQRLSISRASIAQSLHVTTPLVVGWLKPVVLIPGSAITGLTINELEAVIAHELAHVKRNDYLANVFQTAVETLCFYHPAVWWLSRKLRIEREYSADELAAELLGNKVQYGRALLSVAELKQQPHVLALAVTDGSLFDRVSRLFQKREQSSLVAGLVAGLLACGSVFLAVVVAYLAVNQFATSLADENAKAAAPTGTLEQMDAEELEAWNALFAMDLNVHGEAFGRRNRKQTVANMVRARFPKDAIEKARQAVNAPIRDVELFDVPEEAWEHLQKLKSVDSLRLTATRMTPDAEDAIAKLKSLRRIQLVNCKGVMPGFLKCLAGLTKLEEIDVSFNIFDKNDEAIEGMLGELTADEKELLDTNERNDRVLMTAVLTDRELKHLKSLSKLKKLELVNTFCTAKGFAQLAELKRLEKINVGALGDLAVVKDCLSKFEQLETLRLGNHDDHVLEALSDSKVVEIEGWAGPSKTGSGVSWVGLESVAKMPALKRLSLRGAVITTPDLNRLCETRFLSRIPSLEYLDLTLCWLDRPGIDDFRKRWPAVELKLDDDKLVEKFHRATTPVAGRVVSDDGTAIPQGTILQFQSDYFVGAYNSQGSSANFALKEDGSFQIEIPIGDVFIFLTAPGFAKTWAGQLRLKPGVPVQDLEVKLIRGKQTTVRVVDQSGNRIPQAGLLIWPEIQPGERPSNTFAKTTNDEGEYLFHYLPGVRYEFDASKKGYRVTEEPELRKVDGETTVVVRLSKT